MTESQSGQRDAERSTVTTADGHPIRISHWKRVTEHPTAIVQILHGLSEHLGRYARLAEACRKQNLAVVGHDHRGHGPDCAPEPLGHFADRDGWNKVVDDAIAVQTFIRGKWPRTPLVLFGHSMGSYVAQSVVARAPENVTALVLSASTWSSRRQIRLGRMLTGIAIGLTGGRHCSPWLHQLGFGNFNRRFAPARTDVDWLSRDAAEVDRNVADPYCGIALSNRLWRDLLGGLLEVTSMRTLRRIPLELPVLITGGDEDPVGGSRGMTWLAEAYARSGHEHVTLKLWRGGRHEMLNEINRDEFTEYLLQWVRGRYSGTR